MTKTGTYKGSPTISLLRTEDDRFPFTFGLKKAQLIAENIDDILNFVAEHEEKERSQTDA